MVCDSVSCYVMGADGLRKAVEGALGHRLGRDDRRRTVSRCCRLSVSVPATAAPTMMIDEELIGDVTADKLGEVFARFY